MTKGDIYTDPTDWRASFKSSLMGYLKLTATSCACLIALIVVENKACTKSSYFDRHPGIHLQGQVIRTVTTCPSGIWNCIIECGKTPGCLSINSHNTGNVTHCDLNKSNRYGKQANVIKTTLDREYLEIVRVHISLPENFSRYCFLTTILGIVAYIDK